MDFIKNYFTLKPLELHWIEVSPANTKGLDYHLSPNLFLRIEDIFSGEEEFFISEVLTQLEHPGNNEGDVINQLEEEHVFMREIMPNKSQGRINRHFKEPDISVFFTNRQMDFLEELFEQRKFIAQTITVYLNGHKVDDIVELGPEDFKLVLNTFEELEIQAGIDYSESKEEFMEAYHEYFAEKVAAKEEAEKVSFWNKLKRKDDRKKIIKTGIFVTVGAACWVGKRVLMKCGWIGKLCAIPIGAIGVVIDMHGQSEAMAILRSLKIKPEGMY